jgi:hypothetical protein
MIIVNDIDKRLSIEIKKLAIYRLKNKDIKTYNDFLNNIGNINPIKSVWYYQLYYLLYKDNADLQNYKSPSNLISFIRNKLKNKNINNYDDFIDNIGNIGRHDYYYLYELIYT